MKMRKRPEDMSTTELIAGLVVALLLLAASLYNAVQAFRFLR